MKIVNVVISGRMKGGLRKKHLFNSAFLAVLTWALTPMVNAATDPLSELRSLSALNDVDLSRLSQGDVSAAGEPLGRFARGMSVQSAYVVRVPVRSTVGLIREWNPTRDPELQVYVQGDLRSRVSPQDFSNLTSAPSNSSVRAFVEATEKLPGDSSNLQLSSAEVKKYSGGTSSGGGVPSPVVAFWSQVLAERARDFLSGGLNAEPPYQNGIHPRIETARLIDNSGNVRSHFSPIISGGRGAPSLSWQLFDANGQAAVSLDAFYAKPVGNGYQTLDLEFYSSGGYYVAVTLQQLWPVKVDGRDATLVWRVDLISSSAFGELRGAGRLGSDAATMREIQKNVKAFVQDADR
jgi:hypothetical protein